MKESHLREVKGYPHDHRGGAFMYGRTCAAFAVATSMLLPVTLNAAPLGATWERERPSSGAWVSDEASFAPNAEGVVIVSRGAPHHSRSTAVVDSDLSATPCIQIEAHSANAQWRLTGSFDGGSEVVIADRQAVGLCVRDLADLFGTEGAGELRLHLHIWGWGNGSRHYVRFTPAMVAAVSYTHLRAHET